MGEVRFGGYRLERLLGRGGMGQVWLAFDDAGARWVALKLLPAELAADAGYRKRFEREAEAVAKLSDPHIPRVHRFGEIDGRLYIDMQFVAGADLASTLAAGPVDPVAAVGVVGQVAAALDVAHRAGLVHRDVKPSNIVVHASGFAYLIDFGIAHGIGQTAVTTTGLAIGTLAYMAPERFTGTADARADVYSLACVLYECLTGARPYGDTDPAQQMHAHLMTDPPRAGSRNSAVSAALDAVITCGMAKKPADRYATAGDFAAAAYRAVGTRPRTPPVPAAQLAKPLARTRVLPERGPTRVETRLGRPRLNGQPSGRVANSGSQSRSAARGQSSSGAAAGIASGRPGAKPLAPTKMLPEPGPTPTRVATRLAVPLAPRQSSGAVVPQQVARPRGAQQRYPVGYGRRVFPKPAKPTAYQRRPLIRWQPILPGLKRRKRGGVLSKVIGVLVVVFLAPFMLAAGCMALLASGNRASDSGGGAGTPPPSVAAEEDPGPPPEQHRFDPAVPAPSGTPVRDGKFEFVVTDLDTGVRRVGLQSAEGSFSIVTLAVRNISDEPKWFLPFGQRLYDATGTSFDPNAPASIWQATQHRYNYSFELAPGESATTQLVFDLPRGTTPNHVELHDFVLSNGVAVRVD
ncbi:protein kinase [Nocardia sp. NPDC049149]|uniref:protein kinase domain-containing protein n=1 Tax=Nocardia sp. NPDC049149 TaxID=3364315 RepID=UPI003719592D